MRIVRVPDGRVMLDESGRQAGRGAYLCADGRCWQTAGARGTIARALDVTASAELAAIIAAGPPMTGTQPMQEGGARGQE